MRPLHRSLHIFTFSKSRELEAKSEFLKGENDTADYLHVRALGVMVKPVRMGDSPNFSNASGVSVTKTERGAYGFPGFYFRPEKSRESEIPRPSAITFKFSKQGLRFPCSISPT